MEEVSDLEWEDLWRRDPNATPFQSPHWQRPWWKHFGSGELFMVTTRGGGRLLSLAPLYIVREDDESLGLLLGTGITDYLDVLGPADGLIERIGGADCQMWDLQQLRPSSPLLQMPVPDGWGDCVDQQESCPVLDLSGELLSTHARKKLRYFARCLEREGAVTYEQPARQSLDDFMTALFDLHASRWKRKGLPGVLADDIIQPFHRDAARRMLDAGALRMHAIRLDGRFVAVFYGFAHHGTVYYYLSGYDASLEKLSIGNLIVAHAVREAIREGAHTFDFLRGAEEYKYAWGAKDRMNRRRVITPR